MATSPRSFVQTLIGAIPAEDGAALMARAGEVARITSSAGSVDVGAIALTAEAIDEMSTQLLPPDQLQTFRESGTGQGEFVTADGAGAFEVLAAATDGDRWIEVRRRARAQAPAEEALVAELLSRSGPPRAATAPKAVSVPVPVAPQAPEAAPIAVAAAEPVDEAAGAGHDLEVPSNFQFANDTKFEDDDLAVPGGLLEEPAAPAPAPEPARPRQGTKPMSVTPKIAASISLSDRLRSHGRMSILLPAIIVLVVGLPSAGWFVWMRHSTAAPVAAAPSLRPMLKSRRLPNALSHALIAPIPGASFSVQNVSAPVPSNEPPVVPAAVVTRATGTGFSIQVAAVHARDEADRIAAKLVQGGYSSYVVSGEGAATGFYRVRVGAFPDRQAAEDVARRIELTEGTKPWIVKDTR
jgi:cell division septation protein DedD